MKKAETFGTAIEGVSYAGKTTTLLNAKTICEEEQKDIILIPEYSQIGRLPTFSRNSTSDVIKAIQIIIDLEKKRSEYLSTHLAQLPESIVLWNRGPISCVAFEIAVINYGLVGLPEVYIELLTKEYELGNIIIPNKYMFLDLSLREIISRETAMINSGHSPNIEFLRSPRTIESFQSSFRGFSRKLPNENVGIYNSEYLKPEALAKIALRFAGSPAPNQTLDPSFLSL